MMQVVGTDQSGSPALALKSGSLASYFYAPHPQPGKGCAFSPKGDLILRYGFGPDIKILNAKDVSLITTLTHMVRAWRRRRQRQQCCRLLR